MKKLTKVAMLSIAIIAAALLLNSNSTNADNGQVQLQISGGAITCDYGKSLNFGATGQSYSSRSLISGFLSSGGNAARYCNDLSGTATWNISIRSSDILNVSTNNAAHTIGSGRAYRSGSTATVVSGTCTAMSGDSLGTRVPLSGTRIVLGKVGTGGDTCKVQASAVQLRVDLTGSQAIGLYSGNITIDLNGI